MSTLHGGSDQAWAPKACARMIDAAVGVVDERTFGLGGSGRGSNIW